jgi:hypothetical protein
VSKMAVSRSKWVVWPRSKKSPTLILKEAYCTLAGPSEKIIGRKTVKRAVIFVDEKVGGDVQAVLQGLREQQEVRRRSPGAMVNETMHQLE